MVHTPPRVPGGHTPRGARSLAGALVLAWSALVLIGCAPVRFTVDLGPSKGALTPTVVMKDPGSTRHEIALIDVRGVIADRHSSALLGSGSNPVDEFLARLDKAAADDRVKAVIVRINSPGGTVTASDTMERELVRFRETTGKPVIASMGEVAASGGYYLALGADEIIAQPTTITGSIGVIMPLVNVSEGLARIGVYARPITSGPNKDMGDPLSPPDEAHDAILQHLVDQLYGRFRELVVERRPGLDAGDVARATDGRVFLGIEAEAIGLVDSVGTLRDAFARAKALAGIERAELIKYHAGGDPPRTPYAASPADAPRATTPQLNLINVQIPDDLVVFSSASRFYYLWTP